MSVKTFSVNWLDLVMSKQFPEINGAFKLALFGVLWSNLIFFSFFKKTRFVWFAHAAPKNKKKKKGTIELSQYWSSKLNTMSTGLLCVKTSWYKSQLLLRLQLYSKCSDITIWFSVASLSNSKACINSERIFLAVIMHLSIWPIGLLHELYNSQGPSLLDNHRDICQ